MKEKFTAALCQMKVMAEKAANISKALEMTDEAAANGAEIMILPEMFNCPYDIRLFSKYAETENRGETIAALIEKARDLGVYIVGGSIPEADNGHIYNTCYIIGRDGQVIGKHRKVHLFDIDIKGKITFRESEVLSAGDSFTVVDTDLCRIGIGICYDMRFPELSGIMTVKGAELLIFPGAFNMVTGPAHWELLIRARALDNQSFVAAVSPARDSNASYKAYGCSAVADPWGEVIAMAGTGEEIIYAEIDGGKLDRIRRELPLLKHRRGDIYRCELRK